MVAMESANINMYLYICVFGKTYMRKECSVSLAAGLVNQRSPSANLTGARKGYVATKLQTEPGFGRWRVSG